MIRMLFAVRKAQMASVKIILRSKANKDGKHSLIVQTIKDRKKSLIHLGQHLHKDDWDVVQQRVKNRTRILCDRIITFSKSLPKPMIAPLKSKYPKGRECFGYQEKH
jgi:hypothetical protein